jgi:Protein of unknown function (DUF1064)
VEAMMAVHLTERQYQRIADVLLRKPKPRRHKYNAKRTTVDGQTFDSQHEAQWFCQLRIRERLGEIRHLRRQVRYPLIVNGVRVAYYQADAVYEERCNGRWIEVIADCKSEATRQNRVYRLKRKIMAALGHPIKEIV